LTTEELYQMLKNLSESDSHQTEKFNDTINKNNDKSTIGNYINNCIHELLSNELLYSRTITPYKGTLADVCEDFYNIDMIEFDSFIIRGKNFLKMGSQSHYGFDATPDIIWSGLMPAIKKNLNSIRSLFTTLPGFKDIKTHDTASLIKSKIPFHYAIKYAPLFIDGEFYHFLDNGIQYIVPHLYLTLGNKFTNELCRFFEDFNKLNLTKRETSLILPLVLTISSKHNLLLFSLFLLCNFLISH
jgi:hypothetical protein